MLGRLKELPEFMLVRALRSVVEDVELSMTAVGAVPCLRLPAGASFFCGSPLQSENENGILSTLSKLLKVPKLVANPKWTSSRRLVLRSIGSQPYVGRAADASRSSGRM